MAGRVKWWTHWIDQIGIVGAGVAKYGVILMAYISRLCENIIVELLKRENLIDCIIDCWTHNYQKRKFDGLHKQ